MKLKKTYIAKPAKKVEMTREIKKDSQSSSEDKRCRDCTNPHCKCFKA
jgi:hypothetical protein